MIVATVRMNSPITPRELVKLLEELGINERRFYRRIENLVENEEIVKGGSRANTIYFVMEGINSVNTVDELMDGYGLSEYFLPKFIKGMKRMNAQEMQSEIMHITSALGVVGKIRLMLMTDLPLPDSATIGEDALPESKRVLSKMNNPTKTNVKELVKKLDGLLEQYFDKLRKKDHDAFIFMHNALFNSI